MIKQKQIAYYLVSTSQTGFREQKDTIDQLQNITMVLEDAKLIKQDMYGREEVDKNENWACPGCAHLYDEQKHKRCSESIIKELIHVTWEPTREPEELKDT